MRILVYEYFTGGGLWSHTNSDVCAHPLLSEGHCMVRALCADLARLPDVQVIQLRDSRLHARVQAVGEVVDVQGVEDEREQLARHAGQTDGVILIAPERDRQLLERCELVERAGGRLLSPDAAFVQLTSDKHATGLHLTAAGVGVPPSSKLDALHSPDAERWSADHAQRDGDLSEPSAFPVVLKPVDGVGSLDTYVITNADHWRQVVQGLSESQSRGWLVERYQVGTAVSVAALCGRRGQVILPPCRQRISDDGHLTYLGGELPLSEELSARACELARATLTALPGTTGYVGIDMVLGDGTQSPQDVVVDVNPRLTTSYLGLRHAASVNLAQAMLSVLHGRHRALFFRPCHVKFDCHGQITEEV